MNNSRVRSTTARRGGRTRAAVLSVAAAAGAVVLTLGLAPAASAASDPTVTVSPSTGLSDGDAVSVSGSGFPANTQIFVVECAQSASDASGCNVNGVKTAKTDGSGSFSLSDYAVAASFKDVDCTATKCVIQGNAGTTADAARGTSAPLQFGAAATTSTSPSTTSPSTTSASSSSASSTMLSSPSTASTSNSAAGGAVNQPSPTVSGSGAALAWTGAPTSALAALAAALIALGGGALWLARRRTSHAH